MTEAEWLACEDPEPMLEFLRGKAGDRKLRLFAVACCRRIWHLILHNWSKEAVEVAEMNENGLVDSCVVEGRSDQAERAIGRVALRSEIEEYAATAAAWAVSFDPERRRQVFQPAAVAVGSMADPEDWTTGRNKEFASQCGLLRCAWGPLPFRPVPFSPSWRTSTAVALAAQMYESREFGAMPILADALQDAGCDNADVLSHCRDAGAPHVRGCWVVDLLLGKE
ncbi:hypothetical protein [Gemmata palustris]|uniref:hypothetical protein n=1 Tax=Gemmata palustris TaxID=2822762 RepID=UPI001FEB6B69|nr:hypothetical protein [Gemmata palustris]